MAPSIEALENDLRDGVRSIVADGGWDEVTVNNVRQHVEKKGGLKNGFFKTDKWEARSKKIIKEFVAQLLAEEEATSSPVAPKTKPKKRHSSEEPSPAPKRQKKAPQPTKKAKSKKEESESELSDLDDQSEIEPPKKAAAKKATKKDDSESDLSELSSSEDEPQETKPKKLASRRKSNKAETESELSDLGDSEEEPQKKAKVTKKVAKKPAPRRKSKGQAKEEEDEASDLEDSAADKKRKRAPSTKKQEVKPAEAEANSDVDEKNEAVNGDTELDVGTDAKSIPQRNTTDASKAEGSDEDTKPKDPATEDTTVAKADDSDSDLSSVLDEPPPKKRKSKEPKGASKPKQTKELSGDEVEIKKLQAQLLKCGIRKIWGIELKKYGDDTKGKIRHLKGMLRDAGMDGRFSEAKAKEIKEKRELMADLEAVTEMDRNWGSGRGAGRASRSKAVKKSVVEEPDNEDEAEDQDEEDQDEDEAKGNPRMSKRMADLAFLGDDSESD